MRAARKRNNYCGLRAPKTEAIRAVLAQVNRVAPTGATVLLLGETGVGKGVFAQVIHDASPRRRLPMVRVSCAALPRDLIESELFGHERGAFTGALSRRIGRFEAANGSTLFLDEIGELPLDMQGKLLSVLQERTIERLGDSASITVDVRIIAATHRDLKEAVRSNTFREDLFYRLNVFPITIPPLRERVDDVPELAWAFVKEMSRTMGKPVESISTLSLRELQCHPWPGNVRELRNVIERAMIDATGPVLSASVHHSIPQVVGTSSEPPTHVPAEHIRSVHPRSGVVAKRTVSHKRLGLKATTLESPTARLGMTHENRSVPA